MAAFLLAPIWAPIWPPAWADARADCVDCHRETTPGVVSDWVLNAHHELEIGCADNLRRHHRPQPQGTR